MDPKCFPPAQECVAKIQQAWAQGQNAIQDGMGVAHETGARLLDRAAALGQTGMQRQIECAAALSRSAVAVMAEATAAARQQADLWLQFPGDPAGIASRLMAGGAEMSRKTLQIGAGAVQATMQALTGAWSDCAKAGQESAAIMTDAAQKGQAMVEKTITSV